MNNWNHFIQAMKNSLQGRSGSVVAPVPHYRGCGSVVNEVSEEGVKSPLTQSETIMPSTPESPLRRSKAAWNLLSLDVSI
jgi:hypothetical protein